MKNFSLIFAAVLLTAIAAGCSSSEKRKDAIKPVIIAGKISNLDVYPDYLTVTASVTDFRNRQKTYTNGIKPDGTFRVELDLYTTQDINFSPIVRTLMARPGDSSGYSLLYQPRVKQQSYKRFENQRYSTDLSYKSAGNYLRTRFVFVCSQSYSQPKNP